MHCAHLVRLFFSSSSSRSYSPCSTLSLFLCFVGAVHVRLCSVSQTCEMCDGERRKLWLHVETRDVYVCARFVVCQKRNYGKLWIIIMIICEQQHDGYWKRYKASTLTYREWVIETNNGKRYHRRRRRWCTNDSVSQFCSVLKLSFWPLQLIYFLFIVCWIVRVVHGAHKARIAHNSFYGLSLSLHIWLCIRHTY